MPPGGGGGRPRRWPGPSRPSAHPELDRSGRARRATGRPVLPGPAGRSLPRATRRCAPGPAVADPDLGVTWVSRHADILAVLHDPKTFSSDIGEALRAGRVRLLGFEPSPEMDAVLAEVGGSPPLADYPPSAADPPDHTRVRKLVATAFTPRRVAALEPAVLARAQVLVDEIVGGVGGAGATPSGERGSVELVAAFARPLPLQVMAAAARGRGRRDRPAPSAPMPSWWPCSRRCWWRGT